MLAQAVSRRLAGARHPRGRHRRRVDITDATRRAGVCRRHPGHPLHQLRRLHQRRRLRDPRRARHPRQRRRPDQPGQAAARLGAAAVHISTDYVFDGGARAPTAKTPRPAPPSAYGRSKLAGERGFLAAMRPAAAPGYVVRTSWLFGRGGKNFVSTMLRLMQERDSLASSPTRWAGPPTATIWRRPGGPVRARAGAPGRGRRRVSFCQRGAPAGTALPRPSWPRRAPRACPALRAGSAAHHGRISIAGSTACLFCSINGQNCAGARRRPRPWQATLTEYIGHWTQGAG